jgi:hypothetical protein
LLLLFSYTILIYPVDKWPVHLLDEDVRVLPSSSGLRGRRTHYAEGLVDPNRLE